MADMHNPRPPYTLNYRESSAYQAVELRYELPALFRLPIYPSQFYPCCQGGTPLPSPPRASPLTFNMKWSWHFIVYSPRLGHFSPGGRRNLRSGIILADKTRCCSRGRGLKRRSLNAACFLRINPHICLGKSLNGQFVLFLPIL